MTQLTIDGAARSYEKSEHPRYADRLRKPGTGLGACKVAPTTNILESSESFLLKNISPAGTGQKASETVRDVITRDDGTTGEVTVVVNVYHDDTHPEDLARAGYILSGMTDHLIASSNKVLVDMADLGVVEV